MCTPLPQLCFHVLFALQRVWDTVDSTCAQWHFPFWFIRKCVGLEFPALLLHMLPAERYLSSSLASCAGVTSLSTIASSNLHWAPWRQQLGCQFLAAMPSRRMPWLSGRMVSMAWSTCPCLNLHSAGSEPQSFRLSGFVVGFDKDDDDDSDDFWYNNCRIRYYSDDKILTTFAIL